jgi:hypothetical protein
MELSGLLEFQLEEDLAQAVAGLAADRRAGPVSLARRGARIALRLCDKHYYERPLHIWHEVHGLARGLVEARPTCMPLVNIANVFVAPLPEFYGRGKDEGARMRADLRSRVLGWLSDLDARAARIDQQAAQLDVSSTLLSPWAVDDTHALVRSAPATRQPIYLVAGPEKLVPMGYRLPAADGLQALSLDACAGLLTGDDVVACSEVARLRSGLRLEPALL